MVFLKKEMISRLINLIWFHYKLDIKIPLNTSELNIKILSLKQSIEWLYRHFFKKKTRKKFQIVSQTISGSLRHHPFERGQGKTGHQSAKRIKITKKKNEFTKVWKSSLNFLKKNSINKLRHAFYYYIFASNFSL